MRPDLRVLPFLILSLWTLIGFAQTGRYTSFMVKEGLPSSYVYRTLEDNKGFLWVATNSGVARFDGKYFQVFTTRDGLPDNEVFSFVKEADGRIWVECFNQIPAYFDEMQNRFVVPYLPPKKAFEMTNTLGINLSPLPDGGISYSNRDKCVVFKDGKLKSYGPGMEKFLSANIIKEYADGSTLVTVGVPYRGSLDCYKMKLYHIRNEAVLDSMILTQRLPKLLHPYAGGGKAYHGIMYLGFRYLSEFYSYTDLKTNPLRWKTNELHVPETYVNYFITPDRLAFVTESGRIYIYDRHTFRAIHTINNEYLTNSYFNDSKGNEWISTIDKGLVVYRNEPLQSLQMPQNFSNTGFMSIARKKDGTVLAGNFYGEVVTIKNKKQIVHKIIDKSPARIRKILTVGDDVYTFSEEGIYRNFKERIPDPHVPGMSVGKVAIKYNDSIILVGTHRNLLLLNTHTHKLKELNLTMKRTTALAKANDDVFYFGSINGLYKCNYKTGKYVSLSGINPQLKKRIGALCYSNDGLLWVSTSDNRILILKNDKIVWNAFINKGSANGSIKNLTAGKPGQVWISTSNGIIVIRYEWEGNRFNYTTRNISVSDGLAGNDVQELFYSDGAMYAATNNGISIIPENHTAPKNNIPTYLVRMSINQNDTIITDRYDLKYRQQDIQMQFAGVDLNGYFKHLQYQLDQGERWIDLSQNTLAIQLGTGDHLLKVRAVDVNGNASNKTLILKFDVAIPFWLSIWFWIVCGAIAQVVLFYLISRYQKRKKEAKLALKVAAVQAAAIEQQAFTSLMNPHFIFNALNSIQHYINVQDRKNANRYLSDFASLIRKNFDAAHQSFIPLEEEIENIKIYLNLEWMRFNDRFNYELQIDNALEVEDWMIPTMMLQPLLENALLHGIMPSNLPGEITVQFKLQQHDLMILIIDNGIGLENSLALKGEEPHKSRGTELIGKRIKALSHFGSKSISINMEPAFPNDTNPGNKVTIVIPDALYESWRGRKKL